MSRGRILAQAVLTLKALNEARIVATIVVPVLLLAKGLMEKSAFRVRAAEVHAESPASGETKFKKLTD